MDNYMNEKLLKNSLYGQMAKKPHFTNVDDSNISEIRNVLSDYISKHIEEMSCKKIIELVSDQVDFTLDYYYLKNELIKELYFSYILYCEMKHYVPKTGWLK